MATSGTHTFNPDIGTIIEEAFERCGLELRTSYDLVTARRSLDILLNEWENHQVHIWKTSQDTVNFVKDQASYTISAPALDVLDAVDRDTNTSPNNDLPMDRIPYEEYLNRPDKTASGRSTHYAILRGNQDLTLFVWPVPEESGHEFRFYKMQQIEDVGSDYTNTVDTPRRFQPAVIAGLAYKIAQKRPARVERTNDGQFVEVGGVPRAIRQELKQDYLEQFEIAKDEDRDRSSLYIVPNLRHY